jgi:hypothetical protein
MVWGPGGNSVILLNSVFQGRHLVPRGCTSCDRLLPQLDKISQLGKECAIGQ